MSEVRDKLNCHLGCETPGDCFVGKIREGLVAAASSNEVSLQQVLDGSAPANNELLEQADVVGKVQQVLSVCALEGIQLKES